MAYKDIEKQKLYQRIWSRDKKQRYRKKAIEVMGGKCERCSYDENYLALQIDHVDPILRKVKNSDGQTLFRQLALGKITRKGLQLLCANCHAIKTYEDRMKFANYIES